MINDGSEMCTKTTVGHALDAVLDQMPGSLSQAWTAATASPRKDALFDRVLLACALTKRNASGWFFPGDIRDAFCAVTKKEYAVNAYSPHLHSLADGRGRVLDRIGESRKHQFRFRNPMFQSFVIMHGLETGLLAEETLDRFRENLPG